MHNEYLLHEVCHDLYILFVCVCVCVCVGGGGGGEGGQCLEPFLPPHAVYFGSLQYTNLAFFILFCRRKMSVNQQF